jgi:1,4-dihydroxy-2-naphthoate octaprenyltransferase
VPENTLGREKQAGLPAKDRMQKEKVTAWLRIMRLQFYPMTLIAYGLGAAIAASRNFAFSLSVFVLGYAYLFLLEFCAILANELFDLPSDRINKNASPFNGGSRVLVEGRLGPAEVKKALGAGLLVLTGLGLWLVMACHSSTVIWVVLLLAAGLLMGLGYTVPPLKFCYRGLGELVVGIMQSPYVILCGYVFQTGTLTQAAPWLVGIPLFFAVLAAITLSGIPDHQADKAVSKKTLSVLLGQRQAALLSGLFATLAAFAGIGMWRLTLQHDKLGLFMLAAVGHGIILIIAVARLAKMGGHAGRIDGVMLLALSYIIWFTAVPLAIYLRV